MPTSLLGSHTSCMHGGTNAPSLSSIEGVSAKKLPLGGLPQGSPLSPLAFKLAFLPPPLDKSDAHDFLFMDDYSMIVKAYSREELRANSQRILDKFWNYAKINNFLFDSVK